MGEFDKFSDTYEILGKLGEGSGGIVYKAYHKRLKKEVVIKQMKGRSISVEADRQEVDILKNLHHTYLPQVFDFLKTGDRVYTVMSYIPGKSFQQLLRENYTFTLEQLVRWGMQLCSALNYLHSQKPPIIHSDIKPANIMLTPQGSICLIDFNISFFLDEQNEVLGYTDGYTSPEQYIIVLDSVSGRSVGSYRNIDEKTDIYSVGATFYHLATGKKPKSYKERIDRALLTARTSAAFCAVIEKAMEVDPNKRFSSAFEMFQAFQAVPEKDKRYRALVRRQHIIRGILVAGMAGCIVLGGYGIHRIRLERLDKYNDLVEEQTELIDSREYEKAGETFEEAVSVMPSGLEAYYQQALSLYEQQNYRDCISFVDYDIEGNEDLDLHRERMGDVYYLEADSHFQLGEYEEAVETYEKLFRTGGYDAQYYRDYAIALAYDDQTEKAQEVLDEAVSLGLTEDSVYYARGEIKKSLQDTDGAIQDFRFCVGSSQDNELKARAYIQISDLYGEKGQDQSQRDVLVEARQALPEENQMILIQRLIQSDMDLADKSGNTSYREEAIALLKEVIAQGWDSYDTYNNLVILNEKQADLEQAEAYLSDMLEKFGEDYNIYKRYAFLEVDIQEQKENSDRNYEKFAAYYQKASELYYEQLQNNNTDAEMQLLENLYQQVLAGGWLS